MTERCELELNTEDGFSPTTASFQVLRLRHISPQRRDDWYRRQRKRIHNGFKEEAMTKRASSPQTTVAFKAELPVC